MTNNYDPVGYARYPHIRFRCQCGESAIAIGWEVETVVCDSCGSPMEWDEDLHNPR